MKRAFNSGDLVQYHVGSCMYYVRVTEGNTHPFGHFKGRIEKSLPGQTWVPEPSDMDEGDICLFSGSGFYFISEADPFEELQRELDKLEKSYGRV